MKTKMYNRILRKLWMNFQGKKKHSSKVVELFMRCFYRGTQVERNDKQDYRRKTADIETSRMQCSHPP